MENWLPRAEAARLAQTDISYLEKLRVAGELECRAVQNGRQRRWEVNTACPRFQRLMARLTPPAGSTEPSAPCLDWEEWELMCRDGEVLTARRCSNDTITAYRYWIGRFFATYPALDRGSLRVSLHQWDDQLTPDRDFYCSRNFLFRAMMTVARYYVFKGYRPESFVEEMAVLRPKKAVKRSSRTSRAPNKILGALTALEIRSVKKGHQIYTAYDQALNAAFVTLALTTAARNSELCNLRLRDINWAERRITLHGKGGKIRAVGLHPEAAKAVRRYMALRPATHIEYLFVWARGEEVGRMNRRYFARRMARIAKRFPGLGRLNPHSLRGDAITWFLRAGLSVDVVRDIAGHSSLAVTNLYARPTEEDIAAAMCSVPF